MENHPYQSILTSIAGIRLNWLTDCEEEVKELRRVLKYHLRSEQEVAGQTPHTVKFMQVTAQTAPPADAVAVWEGPYMGLATSNNKVEWHHSPTDGLDYLRLNDEICLIHNRRESLTECRLLSRENDGKWIRPRIWDAMVIILHTVMSMHGRYSLHSAAVGLDGKAHLFIGETGHGKSTLCTDLVNMGADFMGDDLTFLYLENGTVMAGSLLLDAKLFANRWAREKDWVDVVARYGCEAPLSLPLGGMYYISRAKGESRLERHEPIDCMIALIRASNNVRMQYDPDLWQSTQEQAAMNHKFFHFHFGNRKTLTPEIFRNV